MSRRISDSGALKRSKPGQMLEEDLHNLSAPEPLPGRSLPTDDVAFALQPNLMKPFSRKYLDLLTRIFDYRFSRARRISADVFGIITNLWRVYSYPISLRLENCIIGYEVDSPKLFICRLYFVIPMTRRFNDQFPVAAGKKIITIA